MFLEQACLEFFLGGLVCFWLFKSTVELQSLRRNHFNS